MDEPVDPPGHLVKIKIKQKYLIGRDDAWNGYQQVYSGSLSCVEIIV
jgi:hypothetical protein